MFSDDNFGNIQRLPTAEEAERPGGVGVSTFFSVLQIQCQGYRLMRHTSRYISTWNMLVLPGLTSGITPTTWYGHHLSEPLAYLGLSDPAPMLTTRI